MVAKYIDKIKWREKGRIKDLVWWGEKEALRSFEVGKEVEQEKGKNEDQERF